jgi:ornithine cyclodeaminase/alanine dehydrogenase-like protein (mu-crystallin family)
VIGTGGQARYQLLALLQVRPIEQVTVWGRRQAAEQYQRDSGELRHALEAGLLEAGSVYGELTAVASGRLAGRTADDELTVADLTGLGIQDAAVAALAARLADEHGAGRDVPLGDW